MKKIALILIGFSSLNLNAQLDTIKYEIIENNLNYNYLGGGLLYSAEMSGYNMSLGILGINSKFYNSKFDASIDVRNHFYEGNEIMYNKYYSVNSPLKSNDFGLSFNYYLINKKVNNEISVSLARVNDVKYITYVKAKTAVRYGVEFGFKKGSNFYSFADYEFEEGTSTSEPIFTAPVSSNLNYTMLSFGFNKVEVEGLTIKTDRFGIKKHHSFVKYYSKVLVMVYSEFDDILIDKDPLNSFTYKVNDIKRLPIGLLIGYEHYSLGKIFHAGWALEGGIMPGASAGIVSNLAFNVKVMINFGKMF